MAPWEVPGGLRAIPRELLERVAVPRVMSVGEKSPSKKKNKQQINSPPSNPSLDEQTEVREVLELLKPQRWDDYRTWMLIATALKNLGGGSDAYKSLWLSFSSKSPKFDPTAAEELWSTVARPGHKGSRLTMASVCGMARVDSPDGLAELRVRHEMRRVALSIERQEAVEVNIRHITLDSPEIKAGVELLLNGQVNMLSVKSPMGTGKSTFLDKLLGLLPSSARILSVTYRQSLAMEHLNKFKRHGFVSYMDHKRELMKSDPLLDKPRVICQVESLHRLFPNSGQLPKFDLVILDEIESLLRHFVSPTVQAPHERMDQVLAMVKDASIGAIALDAMWGLGGLTPDIMKGFRISNKLIVNTRATEEPRTFRVEKDIVGWMNRIKDDVAGGKKVVVASLSSEIAHRVMRMLTRTSREDGNSSSSDNDFVHLLMTKCESCSTRPRRAMTSRRSFVMSTSCGNNTMW